MPTNQRREPEPTHDDRRVPERRKREDEEREEAEREGATRDEYRRDRFTTDDDDRAGRHWHMRAWLPVCTSLRACGWSCSA
jgi:hypothetical protein